MAQALGRGSVSQTDLRRPELAHELRLGQQFLRRAIRLLEDLEAVGLSFSQSSVASAPFASRRARLAATSTSWNKFGTFCRQSSTVIRAICGLVN
jgi:hypothetical protein